MLSQNLLQIHGAPYESRTRLFRLKICGQARKFNARSYMSCFVLGMPPQLLNGRVGTVSSRKSMQAGLHFALCVDSIALDNKLVVGRSALAGHV